MRITDKILNAQIDLLNNKTNNALTPATKINDKLIWNIGNYHLSFYDFFVSLHKISNDSGGVSEICSSCTRKELYKFIQGILLGLDRK